MFNRIGYSPRTAGFLLTLLILVAGAALAQTPDQAPADKSFGSCWRQGNGPGDRQEMRLERMAARLDLTDEQTQAIKEIREGYQEQNLALRKTMMRLRTELEGAWLADDISEKTIVGLTEKIGDVKKELAVNRSKCRLEVAAQLTPEQRDKMLMMGHAGRGAGGHDMQGRGRCGGRSCEFGGRGGQGCARGR